MYINGYHVKKDGIKGWEFISAAADKGSILARDYLDSLLEEESVLSEERSEDSEQ